MRRAFTLVELLVIIAIIGAMVAVSVVSIDAGKEAARMRGAVRDVFATIRQARSIALVTQKPSIITFSTRKENDEAVSRVEINSAELLTKNSLMTSAGRPPRSLDGYRTVGDDEGSEGAGKDSRQAFVVSNRDGEGSSTETDDSGGHTVEEALFQPIDEEVLTGICIKVVMDGEEAEELPGEVNEARKAMVSTFSNVDVLLGVYKEHREKQRAQAKKDSESDIESQGPSRPAKSFEDEEKSILWQANGRSDAHTVYIYADGGDYLENSWRIRVDMFGATKVLSAEDDDI